MQDLEKSGIVDNIAITNIDSDDLICKDYFKKISAQLENHPVRHTIAAKGFISDFRKCQSFIRANSPFITDYYASFSQLTINGFRDTGHVDILKYDYFQNHNAEWMQVIHGRNVHNDFSPLGICGDYPHHYNAEPLMQFDKNWFNGWAGFDAPLPETLIYEY